MTTGGDLIGQRYRIERSDRAVGALRRHLGTDMRLSRPVLVWISEQSGAEEDALLELARAAGQWSSAAFLRVLDVTYEDDLVAVVLEAVGTPLADAQEATIEARSARALLDAIDDTRDADAFAMARASTDDLAVDGGEVIADPIALFLPSTHGEHVASLDELQALLAEHIEDDAALDREPARLRARVAVASATGAGAAPYIDDEPTAVFTRPATATAVVDRPRAEARPAAPTPRADRASTPSAAAAATAPAEGVPKRGGAMPWRIFIPLYGVLAVVVVGALIFALRSPGPGTNAVPTAVANQPFGPPVAAPAAGRVTVGLAATEDSGVRVTVDDVVQFDGILKAGQRQAYDGKQRIAVWTDKGKTLSLAVNGRNLGPYSPAMGHADWNRIDFSFWPGWGQ